ncbi:MAG: ABC transporter substrate-binding protein [Caldilineaceae bacterium]
MNKQQRIWLVNLLIVVALVLSACGGPAAAPAQEEAAPAVQEQASDNQPAAVSTTDGGCPTVTVADMLGVAAGAFPQQYDLAEFQELAGCELAFSENPAIAELNGRITGNPDSLPTVAERLPAEPLVIAPYDQIGVYGGILDGLSNATEAGTSDLLSVRHVNLVRYADDLQTIVPSVAKGWEWNEDFTQLTFFLRQGHKWSDGQPFTAEDISFWYNDLISNRELFPEHPGVWVFGGEPMTVEAVDATTVRFTFPTPAPGVLSFFAVAYIQPFQPKHFLSQFHIDYNPDANTLAEEAGLASWTELLNRYFGGSDWKDVPSRYSPAPMTG